MVTILDTVSRTFKEFRFIPRLTPKGLSKDTIDFSTFMTKDAPDRRGTKLKLPVMSAAMQSVTGPEMAIALAQQGGIGVIFSSQPIDAEARMVRDVKRAKAGFVSQLEILNPESTIDDAIHLIESTGYNTIPVVDGTREKYGLLVGVLEGPVPNDAPRDGIVKDLMRPFQKQPLEAILNRTKGHTKSSDLIKTANDYIYFGETGVSLEAANRMMIENRRKYLPIVNPDGTLKFLVFRKDSEANTAFPNAVVDSNKRYLVAAAINTHDYSERAVELVMEGVDVLVIDASDGFSEYQADCITHIKREFPQIPVIAGNIISGEAFDYLAKLDIDGVKVGMGGGSICITQDQKGTGRGQATAVLEVARHRDEYHKKNGIYIPLTSDGGIVYPVDMSFAFAFGANAVMMGKFFAGCRESPGDVIDHKGQKMKAYWGEGSLKAKEWSGKRYGQVDFDEGVEGMAPYTGRAADNLSLAFAKIAATMISVGARNIGELQENAVVELISDASRIEGGVHDVIEVSSTRR
jgi:IMP dehydrogenase